MVIRVNDTPVGNILSVVVGLTCGILLCCLSFSLFREVHEQGSHRIRRSMRYPVYGAFLSSVFMCFYMGGIRAAVLGNLIDFGPWYCKSASVGYWFSKFFLYIFFVDRLVLSFRDCEFEYNKRFVWFARAVVILYIIATVGGSVISGRQVSATGCVMSKGFVYGVTVYDFGIQLCAIYLFIRPLQILGHEMAETSTTDLWGSERQKRLYKLVTKQLILAVTAILSTLIIVVLFAGLLTDLAGVCMPIDVLVNACCMYSSFDFNQGMYDRLCWPCNRVCLARFYSRDKVIIEVSRQTREASSRNASSGAAGGSMRRVYSIEPSVPTQTTTTLNDGGRLTATISTGTTVSASEPDSP